jgi:acyl-CoA synthetase (AMP-forming)/AMP-acid ligase II
MHQEVISRHIINPEMVLHDHRGTINYDQLCKMIDRWKILLVNDYNAQPGDKIVVEFTIIDAYYYSALFAAFELGLIVIMDWPHAFEEEDVASYRMTMYGRVNFAIISHGQTMPNNPNYNYWNLRRTTSNVDHVITDRDFDLFNAPDTDQSKEIAKSILAEPYQDATWGASGGTTGIAKPAINNHIKLIKQSERHIKYMNYQTTDHAIHTHSILYGAGVIFHFLPTWMTAREHTAFSVPDMKEIVKTIHDKRITKIQFHSLPPVLEFLATVDKLDHTLDVLSLFVVPRELVLVIQEKNINNFYTIFGDTTIGGTWFLKTINSTTNPATYERNCMGPLLDDFFDIQINDGLLWVAIPSINQEWRTSGDRFVIRDGNYYFYGRGNKYRIGREEIVLGDLDLEVDRLFGIGATIAVDDREEKIYLAIWKENSEAEKQLHQYFAHNFDKVKIDQIARGLDPNRFTANRKIDREKLRDYFRHYHLKPIAI